MNDLLDAMKPPFSQINATWIVSHLPTLSHSPLNNTSFLNIFIYRSYIFIKIWHIFFLFPSKGTWKIVLEISMGLLVHAKTKLIIKKATYDFISRRLLRVQRFLFPPLNIWGFLLKIISRGSKALLVTTIRNSVTE